MVTLSLVPAILMGEKSGGWNGGNKAIASIWCVMIDAIYLVPMLLQRGYIYGGIQQ